LLNGRQVVSSGEGRSAEYDQFPSELVSQVDFAPTMLEAAGLKVAKPESGKKPSSAAEKPAS
jgi:arylsulfatase A-like enzyme